MIDIRNIPSLAKAINYWLMYIELTTKSNILAESSIRYPITVYAENILQQNVTLEYPHPNFPNRHIDFALQIKDSDNNLFSLENKSFIELKFLGDRISTKAEQQRFFNDIFRLALINSELNDLYFIACGPSTEFRSLLYRNSKKKDNIFPNLLPSEVNDTGFTLDLEVELIDNMLTFDEEYGTQYAYNYPKNIYVKLLFKTSVLPESTMQVFIWQISSL